ncbi:ribonuclease T2 family protein [Francisella hispaniensis]|uniref:ribonuclease T2 family protein n=1 Tax=Francisella hispaniensis TaxID=622488 RepID=UPI001902EFA3|nr:hypothetical protein [Francisella hispaniensis]MBK2357730.1 hypothetical protein [Francisella hispaniensis]
MNYKKNILSIFLILLVSNIYASSNIEERIKENFNSDISLITNIYTSDNIAGRFDSYKIAITWTEGFCYTNSGKPECNNISDKINKDFNYAMTLHGLWPNDGARIDYGYCTEASFSKYNEEALNHLLLDYYMPSVNYPEIQGFYLARHEWDKHGICQKVWNQAEYYYISTKIIGVFRDAFLIDLKDKNMISKEQLYLELSSKFPNISAKNINLKCDKNTRNILQEIRISLSNSPYAFDL